MEYEGPKSNALNLATQSDVPILTYRNIHFTQAAMTGIVGLTALKRMFAHSGIVADPTTAANQTWMYMYIDPADYAITGKTTYFRLRSQFNTNATSPAITATTGLYPVSTPGGGAGLNSLAIGTVISGSTVAKALTANNLVEGNSGDFTISSAGFYGIGIIGSGNQAANSEIVNHNQLQVRNN